MIDYYEALKLGKSVIGELYPTCDRVMLTGGLRRGDKQIERIDVLICPVEKWQGELTEVHDQIQTWDIDKEDSYRCSYASYMAFMVDGVRYHVDFTTRWAWGYRLFQRTGQVNFVNYKPGDVEMYNAHLIRDNKLVTINREIDLFKLMNLPMIPVPKRTEEEFTFWREWNVTDLWDAFHFGESPTYIIEKKRKPKKGWQFRIWKMGKEVKVPPRIEAAFHSNLMRSHEQWMTLESSAVECIYSPYGHPYSMSTLYRSNQREFQL